MLTDMEVEFYKEKVFSEKREQFDKLFELLTGYNERYNLTAICDRESVFLKHFLDSAVGEGFLSRGAKVAEIGSGGGFPSVPLKILREDLSFTLIESTGKKCNYLQAVVDNFDFSGVEVKNMRAEDGAKDKSYRERFDFAVARAVARLNTLCEYCMPYVKPGGRFIAWKGDCDEELKEAANAVKVLGGRVEGVERYSLPNGDKRTLVIINKIANTPEKYPRGNGRERKNPL